MGAGQNFKPAMERVWCGRADAGAPAPYAQALSAILTGRGDLRRFTVESLLRGPEPVLDDRDGSPEGLRAESTNLVLVSHFGRVPCGTPLDLGEQGGGDVELRQEDLLVRGRRLEPDCCYLLVARGDSMEGLEIQDGDDLLIGRDRRPRAGEVVVVHLNGGACVRRLRTHGRRMMLDAASSRHESIQLMPYDEATCQGVVVKRVRRDVLELI